jgi:hypothetical protein
MRKTTMGKCCGNGWMAPEALKHLLLIIKSHSLERNKCKRFLEGN